MRCNLTIELSGHLPLKIPASYRKNITSLCKEALSGSDTYTEYYGDPKKNRQKPFTFSVSLPVEKVEKGSLILRGNRMRLYLSACDSLFLNEIYSGLLSLNPEFSAFQPYKMELRNLSLQKPFSITDREMIFRTYSPVLVRDIKNRKGKGFIDFRHENFSDNLFFSVRNLCRNFLDKNYELSPEQVEISAFKCRSAIIRNYGGEIGTSGFFHIKAPPEVLQLIYDAGLGAKRSQGFGMLEVIE